MSTSTFRPFALGQLVMTPAVEATIPLDAITEAVARHEKGDWGNVSDEDARANTEGTHTDDRLLSSYKAGEAEFWVLTEADRSVTTVLLPSDY